MTAREQDIESVLKAIGGHHDWLLPNERIHFRLVDPARSNMDNVGVWASLESFTRFREVQGHLNGKIWRMYCYTGKKVILVDALAHLHDHLVNRLRLTFDHVLQPLALRALEDHDALRVFMDAVLERGEIPPDNPEEQALGFARSIVAPLIFTAWQETRWPFNDGLTFTGLELEGDRGPIRVYSRGPLTGPIANIRVMGGMGIATTEGEAT